MRGAATEVCTRTWRVQWNRYTAVETITLDVPMTEGEARAELKRIANGRQPRRNGGWLTMRVWPAIEPAVGERCVVCGMLVKLHTKTLPQFAKCYR